MRYLLIAILLLGACSAQYFNQDDVEGSFENDLGDLDTMTKDMDFDENFDFLEGADEDEEDPFDFEDEDDEDYEPESDFLEDGEADEAELGELEDEDDDLSSYVRIYFLTTFLVNLY